MSTSTQTVASELADTLVAANGDRGHQYLTFNLAGEIYGVDILRVMEIRGWQGATRVPNQAGYMQGVINLRGAIVPVFELRERFELGHRGDSDETVVIVVRVEGEQGDRIVGIVVDAVSDVLNATCQDVRSTPDFGARLDTRFISGLASTADSMIALLDVDQLLQIEQIGDD